MWKTSNQSELLKNKFLVQSDPLIAISNSWRCMVGLSASLSHQIALCYAYHWLHYSNHIYSICLERPLINRVRPPTALIWWNARQIHDALLSWRHAWVRGPLGRIDNCVVILVMRVTWSVIRSAVGDCIITRRVTRLLIPSKPIPRCVYNRVVYIVGAWAFVEVMPYS